MNIQGLFSRICRNFFDNHVGFSRDAHFYQ